MGLGPELQTCLSHTLLGDPTPSSRARTRHIPPPLQDPGCSPDVPGTSSLCQLRAGCSLWSDESSWNRGAIFWCTAKNHHRSHCFRGRGEGGHSRLKKGWLLSQQNVLEAAWRVGGESPRAYFKEDCEGDEAWQESRPLQNTTSLEVGCLLPGSSLDSVSLLWGGLAGAGTLWLMAVRSACLGRRPDEGPGAIASAPSLCSSSVCGEEGEGKAMATQTHR